MNGWFLACENHRKGIGIFKPKLAGGSLNSPMHEEQIHQLCGFDKKMNQYFRKEKINVTKESFYVTALSVRSTQYQAY